MPPNKIKIFAYAAAIVIVGAIAYIIFKAPSASRPVEGLLLFTRYDCPHCKIVEDFIAQNNLREKLKIIDKEIHDQANTDQFIQIAAKCNIPENELGVPMLYDGTNCLQGDQPIIDYLNKLK